MTVKHLVRSLKAGIGLGIILALAACAPPANRFVGTWFAPTDQSHWVITDKEVTATGPSISNALHAHYILRSQDEMSIINDHGQVIEIFTLSQDGTSLQGEAQSPFGSGTYEMQREK